MYDELIKQLREKHQAYVATYNVKSGQIFADAADALKKLGTDLKDCRNELCLKCGQYQTKHLGSCNGCRWE